MTCVSAWTTAACIPRWDLSLFRVMKTPVLSEFPFEAASCCRDSRFSVCYCLGPRSSRIVAIKIVSLQSPLAAGSRAIAECPCSFNSARRFAAEYRFTSWIFQVRSFRTSRYADSLCLVENAKGRSADRGSRRTIQQGKLSITKSPTRPI